MLESSNPLSFYVILVYSLLIKYRLRKSVGGDKVRSKDSYLLT